ncbi:SDR family NAD(P)-dependent oxidoreductase, partial [Nonomuraea sp. NN258]|uniref:type I polyketide synthase n=1 Tax=Nonomuraea antri TaxID=2730852 RepID=UPI001568BA72
HTHGLQPDTVIGHSQGEITAACHAGALTLHDAARLITLRSKALHKITGRGGMLSVALGHDEVARRLANRPGELSIAVMNGPNSTVVSGADAELNELAAVLTADGVRVRRVPVDYASHSPQVESLREELLDLFADIQPQKTDITFYSTVTGQAIDPTTLDTHYWYDNLRQPVRFEQTTRALLDAGHHTFIEASPHPVLTIGLQETFESAGVPAVAVPTLRKDEGGFDRFLLSAGQAFTAGVSMDWSTVVPAAPIVDLPTYPFQRSRYWLEPARARGDVTGAGLNPAGHPLLGAAVTLAGSGDAVFTGRLSVADHPWLADHAVGDAVLFPGTGHVDLALHAAAHLGLAGIGELTMESPLVLPADGAVRLQVIVTAADERGRRDIAVHAKGEDDEDWTRHAAGTLLPDLGGGADPAARVQVPAGAARLDLDGLYARLADLGYAYGPAFQGLSAAWQAGDDLYAEVNPVGDVSGHAFHPALLDSALHALLAAAESEIETETEPRVLVPFSWSRVSVPTGEPGALRVRLTRAGDSVTLTVADASGAPLATVGELTLRPLDPARLGSARAQVHEVAWRAAEVPAGPDRFGERAVAVGGVPSGLCETGYADVAALSAAVLAGRAVPDHILVTAAASPDDEPASAARTLTYRLLDVVQEVLADDRLLGSALVVLTGDGPEWGPVRGLMRTVHTEHPGRAVLVDVDGAESSYRVLARALALGEPELRVRRGEVTVPRLAAVRPDGVAPALDPEGTALVTGAFGALGSWVARHLVNAYGVRRLLLAGRRGPGTPGAAELVAELTAMGATVTTAACDLGVRAEVAGLLAAVPAEHPLTAVVHAAGVLDDGVVLAQHSGRFDRVWLPKVDAALHLHELTRGRDLAMFVLFSSLAGVTGSAGQANYAAANSFLDALAEHRRAHGLPACSIAWGLWGTDAGVASGLAAGRGQGDGVLPVTPELGSAMFDKALAGGRAGVVAARFDRPALLARAERGALTPVLRGLVGEQARRPLQTGLSLDGLTEPERHRRVLDLVRATLAAVLGHGDAARIEDERPLKELGVDSLTAVELRNRLAAATGLILSATLAFDHPTPAALAGHLLTGLAPATTGEAVLAELESVLARALEHDDLREEVAARITGLLAVSRAPAATPREVDARIETASAAEIFDLIDEEFGSLPR